MRITGSSVLHAPASRVWQAITDPDVLAAVIPGCDGLTPLEPDRFRLTVTLGVASIKGTYTGEVSFAEWTSTGRLRQPSWRGWRPDKSPDDVVRES